MKPFENQSQSSKKETYKSVKVSYKNETNDFDNTYSIIGFGVPNGFYYYTHFPKNCQKDTITRKYLALVS